MKAVRFVIPKTGGTSFRFQIDRGPHFYDTIHYHPEHQITFFLKGEGTSFIGNHVERFGPGDVYLIGKNVPHVSRCDSRYYQENPDLEAWSLSLFFKDETFGAPFFEIPEMAHIKRLLGQASMGIKAGGPDRDEIGQLISASEQAGGFERFQHLMTILDRLANSAATKTLSTVRYTAPSKDADNERINQVFGFLSGRFQTPVSLTEVAAVAAMTPNAFCRWFRHRTGKAYSVFLNDMRVEHAGKLIAGGTDPFGVIAAESGFNSLSYFNRQFKRVTGLSPLQYRKKFGQHPG